MINTDSVPLPSNSYESLRPDGHYYAMVILMQIGNLLLSYV